MDVLSEVLRAIKLDAAVYFNGEYGEPWCFESPESRVLAPVLAPGAEHLIIYHLVLEGEIYTRVKGGERVTLRAGDLVAFPHGHPHELGGGACVRPIDALVALPNLTSRGLELVSGGGNGAGSRLICGFVACDRLLSQAFLAGVPPLIKITLGGEPSGEWLERSLRFSADQAAKREPGAEAVLAKLSEALFAELLRRYVRDLPAEETGWLAGARDKGVGRALMLIHHRHSHPWTVAELAHEAGLSRSVLSERFKHFLGEPPLAYLTKWRLRVGERALTTTVRSVSQIAYDVGYESEASFNRAFKREYGLPPARYRRSRPGADVVEIAGESRAGVVGVGIRA